MFIQFWTSTVEGMWFPVILPTFDLLAWMLGLLPFLIVDQAFIYLSLVRFVLWIQLDSLYVLCWCTCWHLILHLAALRASPRSTLEVPKSLGLLRRHLVQNLLKVKHWCHHLSILLRTKGSWQIINSILSLHKSLQLFCYRNVW